MLGMPVFPAMDAPAPTKKTNERSDPPIYGRRRSRLAVDNSVSAGDILELMMVITIADSSGSHARLDNHVLFSTLFLSEQVEGEFPLNLACEYCIVLPHRLCFLNVPGRSFRKLHGSQHLYRSCA